jgi:hypothetical protein
MGEGRKSRPKGHYTTGAERWISSLGVADLKARSQARAHRLKPMLLLHPAVIAIGFCTEGQSRVDIFAEAIIQLL